MCKMSFEIEKLEFICFLLFVLFGFTEEIYKL